MSKAIFVVDYDFWVYRSEINSPCRLDTDPSG
ncbi:hypothetical protein SBDP2_110013 [Syntrophobacter sp. SbD2]|nr:hypothetical protein SBDP2_110013 [Syntrophobacter sp. SbD2]